MAKLTFLGGIHPYDGKDLSKDKPIRTIFPKGDLVYPLSQHIGAPAVPIVKKGDYVLTGGELPAMVLIDCVSRMIEGVLDSEETASVESHYNGLLEYPQYTKPEEWEGMKVPPVLLSGHHKNIDDWRMQKSLEITQKNRPDMYERYILEKEKKD